MYITVMVQHKTSLFYLLKMHNVHSIKSKRFAKYRQNDISKDKNIALAIFLKFCEKFLSPFNFLLS